MLVFLRSCLECAIYDFLVRPYVDALIAYRTHLDWMTTAHARESRLAAATKDARACLAGFRPSVHAAVAH